MQELSMNVLDIAQNSVRAGAKHIRIELAQDRPAGLQSLLVADDGCGMNADLLQRATDPFATTRSTRKVGLGLPFLKMAAEMAEGHFSLESTPGLGTTVQATFRMDHIDLAPLGDMPATVATLIQGSPHIDFFYSFTVKEAGAARHFELNTQEVRGILGPDVSLAAPAVAVFLKEYVADGMQEVLAPVGAGGPHGNTTTV